MAKDTRHSIYEQVVKITHVYLGPAAERFIARQVENHLHKSPSKLTKSDLRELIDWIKIVVSFISDDTDIIEEYIGQLRKLSEPKKGLSKEGR